MINVGLGALKVSKQPPAATCSAFVCYAPLSKLMQTRVARLLTSHSQGLLGTLHTVDPH